MRSPKFIGYYLSKPSTIHIRKMSQTTARYRSSRDESCKAIEVDVIVPVHNASATIQSAVESAMSQSVDGERFQHSWWAKLLSVHVCCFDDGSNDSSWELLKAMKARFGAKKDDQKDSRQFLIPSTLWIDKQPDDATGRGAGYARNRAVHMRPLSETNKDGIQRFLCMLDSDDVMDSNRVVQQVAYMLDLSPDERQRTLLGCTFDRDPPDSTWHYAEWANGLTDERLSLERFREVTLLQPTWMMCRTRFLELGGYLETPPRPMSLKEFQNQSKEKELAKNSVIRLIHPTYESDLKSLRVAEDLRFFFAHIHQNGLLHLLRTEKPLVTYRHVGNSQSSQTPRKLLLQLRAFAFEHSILDSSAHWQRDGSRFCVWGAGRDGKDFVKALNPETRKRVYCFVDVDEKKINLGYYVNRDLGLKIPIVHFSMLAADPEIRMQLQQSWCEGGDDNDNKGKIAPAYGRINKGKPKENSGLETEPPVKKKRRLHSLSKTKTKYELDVNLLTRIPVVVCVAMYRTNGALESNVKSVGRIEGQTLWHFS